MAPNQKTKVMTTMDDKSEEDELKKIAPHLFSMDKKNPFSVPENYFDSLPGLIQERIQKKKNESVIEVIRQWLVKPQMAFAAILFVLILAGGIYFYIYQLNSKAQIEVALSEDDLNGSEIIDNTDETILLDELTALNDSHENLKSQDTDIENYLIENQTDLNQIINEL